MKQNSSFADILKGLLDKGSEGNHQTHDEEFPHLAYLIYMHGHHFKGQVAKNNPYLASNRKAANHSKQEPTLDAEKLSDTQRSAWDFLNSLSLKKIESRFTQKNIKKIYRFLLFRYHPDAAKSSSPREHQTQLETFYQLQWAYETLDNAFKTQHAA